VGLEHALAAYIRPLFQEAVYSLHEQVFAAFSDVRKAFDTVWYGGLMVKLSQYNVSSICGIS
jgi:hypothetical protein